MSELKTITLPAAFLQDLPQSTRRSRRKGLRISKDGIAGQKLERMKRLRRQIDNRILEHQIRNDEEMKDDVASRRSNFKSVTNEASFKPSS